MKGKADRNIRRLVSGLWTVFEICCRQNMKMNVLVINCGSSSLKYQLINSDSEEVLAKGLCERIGIDGRLTYQPEGGEKEVSEKAMPTHTEAIQFVIEALTNPETGVVKSLDEIGAVGHRIVHGGEKFTKSCLITDEVIKEVEECSVFAPLHNPAGLIGVRACQELMPGLPMVAVFDTAFHQTLDKERYLYPLPLEYYTDLKVRKYGAHGTSHKYVSQQAIEMLGNPKESRIIVCHLGNGASISAVQDGNCIDTSMGFTPLAGVMMGTRSGDVDPSVMPYLCKKLNKSVDEVLEIYNKKSGMLGISGISSDSRDIENALFNEGNERALLTGLLYARIVSKYIGQYYAELGGCDAIAFTAGVGENAAYLRRLIIDNVSRAFGVFLDEELNNIRSDENRVISHQYSQIKVMVIPTNEEVMIARDTVRLLEL